MILPLDLRMHIPGNDAMRVMLEITQQLDYSKLCRTHQHPTTERMRHPLSAHSGGEKSTYRCLCGHQLEAAHAKNRKSKSGAHPAVNPSYLAVADGRLYVVEETSDGSALSYVIDRNTLRRTGRRPGTAVRVEL